MMPFPFSIRGSVAIPAEAAHLSDRAIMIACVDQIEHERARVVSQSDRSTTFTVPLLSLGSNWRFTVPLSAGSLEITSAPGGERRLRYDFSSRRLALIGTIMVFVMFTVVSVNNVGDFPWWLPVVAWLWLVGMNHFITFVRAPSWVRRRVSDAIKAAAPLPQTVQSRL